MDLIETVLKKAGRWHLRMMVGVESIEVMDKRFAKGRTIPEGREISSDRRHATFSSSLPILNLKCRTFEAEAHCHEDRSILL